MRVPFVDGVNPTWSPPRSGVALGVNNASTLNDTVGVSFNVGRPNISCTGLRFYGVATVAKTVKCKLYQGPGLLTSTTLAISANGLYEVAWAPIALTPFTVYTVCIWQNDGLNYYAYPAANANAPARPFYAGGACVYNNIAFFVAGDAGPTTTAGSEAYPVEPILAGG